MANAAEPINESGILHSHAKTNFSVSHFHYEIKTGSTGSHYVVTDGQQTMDYPLFWAFGVGRVGQSCLFKKEDGNIYEARVSFFEVPNALGAKPTADHPAAACPTATKDFASCHMPKVYVPEMHADFTDHRIRIAKKGEPYPE